MTVQTGALKLNKLHPRFFGELWGLDLKRGLSSEEVDFVERAVADLAVVVVKGQSIGDEEHIRFSRRFGPLELPPLKSSTRHARRIRPELYDASNLDEHGEILAADAAYRAFSKGNELWHTDSSYKPFPTKWSLLMGYVFPPTGGGTAFADMRAAYGALPPSTKSKIDSLSASHDIWHSRQSAGFRAVSEKQRALSPAVVKPMVRRAADGRKALYIGAHASHVVGLPIDEGKELLQELYSFATQDWFVHVHQWSVGDLVIWDNRCTMHRALPYEGLAYKRDLRRTTNMEYGEERAELRK